MALFGSVDPSGIALGYWTDTFRLGVGALRTATMDRTS